MVGERRHISDYRDCGWRYCNFRYHLGCPLQDGLWKELWIRIVCASHVITGTTLCQGKVHLFSNVRNILKIRGILNILFFQCLPVQDIKSQYKVTFLPLCQ